MTITAKVVLDSISLEGVRLTTMELTYPRFIHAEFMTHRMFSRNASSSRAIPTEKMIERIVREPAEPIHWGKNQPGMQANAELEWAQLVPTRAEWLKARDAAVKSARIMHACGAHKQIVNRVLEPFMHITVLVTATEWDNFFHLRRHKDAQPEIKALAEAMYTVYQANIPRDVAPGEWHLPYIYEDDIDGAIKAAMQELREKSFSDEYTLEDIDRLTTNMLCRISTARCARVSYLTHDGQTPSIEKDLALFNRLIISQPMHASPAEHQATPDRTVRYGMMSSLGWENPQYHGNFVGWQQHRKFFLGENVASNTLTKNGVLTANIVKKVTNLATHRQLAAFPDPKFRPATTEEALGLTPNAILADMQFNPLDTNC